MYILYYVYNHEYNCCLIIMLTTSPCVDGRSKKVEICAYLPPAEATWSPQTWRKSPGPFGTGAGSDPNEHET